MSRDLPTGERGHGLQMRLLDRLAWAGDAIGNALGAPFLRLASWASVRWWRLERERCARRRP